MKRSELLARMGMRLPVHKQVRVLISSDTRYLPDPGGKEIRVYDSVDVRFIPEDMYAKLSLCGGVK